MKNKKLTYVLGLGVLVVWGLIIYRIFAASGSDDDIQFQTVASNPVKEAYNDYTIPKDTSHLQLNYRDPFGLKKKVDTVNSSIVNGHHRTPGLAISKPFINWSFIKYSGYIRNPGSKKLIAMVKVNSKNYMLAEGETAGEVKLIKNMRDSIKVTFENKTKFIAMHPEAL